ncbi:MAG TPA: cupin domain-containing protein [Bacteroidales bacterium]|nr:cupin domain-containing protein [Bacteroidales bacterium]
MMEFFKQSEVKTEELGGGVRRKIYGTDDRIMMVIVEFDKDAIGTPHAHPHSQVTYVQKGSFKVTIGDKTDVLKQGDGFYARPDVQHGVVALEEGALIDVFSPMREDFVK